MNFNNKLKKWVIGSACFLVVATGFGAVGTPPASAASAATASASATSAKKADAVVSLAQQLRGKVKYKFGVNNPSKMIFDCSSFTKYVYGKQGVNLKWSSRAQSKQGKFVSKSNLKKGDLVFFSVSTPGKVNHVGIYIGNGKFIHNTTGKSVNGIVTSKLSDYSKRYVTARRVL
ncbi:C40 family peptidase [Paenibacillaceae bacterium WGS1546]|uniref:C40 family peptidase n=1 Tax=Cohnella sp. WGS1546 TaxID=3366810 RepID=UPI00372D00DF